MIRLPAEVAYDFWPWPGVPLLNDREWPDGMSWEPKR